MFSLLYSHQPSIFSNLIWLRWLMSTKFSWKTAHLNYWALLKNWTKLILTREQFHFEINCLSALTDSCQRFGMELVPLFQKLYGYERKKRVQLSLGFRYPPGFSSANLLLRVCNPTEPISCCIEKAVEFPDQDLTVQIMSHWWYTALHCLTERWARRWRFRS